MKRFLIATMGLVLAACSVGAAASSDPPGAVDMNELEADALRAEGDMMIKSTALPDLGVAPELENEVWLNTDAPLRLADLRGQVVLLEMWTFGCYNCKNVIPSLKGWHDTYSDQGFVIIGNHYPEFAYEADLDNLKQAIIDLDIPYAVAQDNDRKTWAAYGNRAWPTLYLIDKWGHIRYTHRGEGRYRETEAAIQMLLAETYP